MKRLLIVNNNLQIGGVQKALVDLLGEISSEYEITLLLFSQSGALRDRVPSNVKVLSPQGALRFWGMVSTDRMTAKEKLFRSFWAALTRIFGRKVSFRLAALGQKRLGPYDAAISFLHSGPARSFYGGCCEFVLERVDAALKIAFLHCDYEKIRAHSPYNTRLYGRFDRIAACSRGCRDSFLRCCPELAKKTVVVPNCHDYPEIRRLAEDAPQQLPADRLKLLSVCRLGREKGILRAIQAIAAIPSGRDRLLYYIIGDGAERGELLDLIHTLHLEDCVVYLGAMENPYGYMRAADLLFIPSVSEAAPLVIGEAASLGTPILSTETSSARELIEELGLGLVCENSVEGMTQALRRLLDDPGQIKVYAENCCRAVYTNVAARAAFLELIGR